MKPGPRTSPGGRGFTLVELVLTLVLIGTLAVFALPAFFDRSDYDAHAFHQQLKNAVRFARRTALATGCDTQVQIQPSGYRLRFRAGAADDQSCGGGAFSVDLADPLDPAQTYANSTPSGVSVGTLTRYFDASGSVLDSAGNPAGGNVSVGGQVLSIEAGTGYVH